MMNFDRSKTISSNGTWCLNYNIFFGILHAYYVYC